MNWPWCGCLLMVPTETSVPMGLGSQEDSRLDEHFSLLPSRESSEAGSPGSWTLDRFDVSTTRYSEGSGSP